jgi:nucleotide-binding universal stress UspA family protein
MIFACKNMAAEEENMKTATVKTAVQFQSILFATDFSPAAALAIPYVKKIAKHYEGNMVALHVRPPIVNPMTEPAYWPVDIEAAKALDEKHREQLLKTFAGIPTKAVIEEGTIHECLNQAIEKNHTDLVVIGTRGRTGVGKLLLGSVAEEIFRTVGCPVLTVGPHADVPRETEGEFRQILYATDFSPESKGAAEFAASLAQELQAQLVLLHVAPELLAGQRVPAEKTTAALEKRLQAVVPPEAGAWSKPKYFVERGDPAETILEFAKERGIDLIVMGVRPEKGVPGAATHLPIATAHKVVREAGCPVLTVRH